jgi:hypothetical protein
MRHLVIIVEGRVTCSKKVVLIDVRKVCFPCHHLRAVKINQWLECSFAERKGGGKA